MLEHTETRTTETLAATDSTQLTADTENAETVHLMVDDGQGGQPATYDLLQEVYSPGESDWMPYAETTATQARSFTDGAVPHEWRITVTNTSGAQATYRLRLIATAPR
ncbi:hypothetical protein [Halomarina oriensis]|uniref:Uncharacterized protein n=1 Tax=Halomarina oriensis TaxID=671145 RepID=A0A6B0GNH9_9EURY|nr:hypothetical protein [Halomarina oriensis]MWG36486.1 hypothetical protein [Halomarina oriensis]